MLIFPEGTRRAPRRPARLQAGRGRALQRARLPVVPVALNSGVFWRRREFVKHPGRIVVEFLEPIPAGLGRKHSCARLEQRSRPPPPGWSPKAPAADGSRPAGWTAAGDPL